MALAVGVTHDLADADSVLGAAEAVPAGEFTVRSELTRYASAFYGPVAFGTTARSAVLTDWPDGGYIGIHGTNAPWTIGRAASHGCVRVPNDTLTRLFAATPGGTPVVIHP